MGNKKTRKPKETEYITIGHADSARRENLLNAANIGAGKASEKDGDVILRVGNNTYGYVVYTILNAKLVQDEHIQFKGRRR